MIFDARRVSAGVDEVMLADKNGIAEAICFVFAAEMGIESGRQRMK